MSSFVGSDWSISWITEEAAVPREPPGRVRGEPGPPRPAPHLDRPASAVPRGTVVQVVRPKSCLNIEPKMGPLGPACKLKSDIYGRHLPVCIEQQNWSLFGEL